MKTNMVGKGMRRAALLPAIILVAGLAAVPAKATVVLDQSQTTSGFVNFFDFDDVVGQTFTVGQTGTLDRIDVHLRNVFPAQGTAPVFNIRLSLQSLSGGFPDGTELASASISPTLLPDPPASDSPYITFDLSGSAIDVAVGDMFAFIIQGEDTGAGTSGDYNIFTSSSSSDAYAGGIKISYTDSSGWSQNGTGDFVFQTFVDTGGGSSVAVPEPGTLAMIGIGLAGLGSLRRRRRT